MGIHEIKRPRDCIKNRTAGDTIETRINITLDRLEQVTYPTIQVLWKTTGNFQNINAEQQRNLDLLNNAAREWFRSKNPQNMHLIDWEKQIKPRSDDRNRISAGIMGDLPPHWGWEARILTAQMVTHAVATAWGDKRRDKAKSEEYIRNRRHPLGTHSLLVRRATGSIAP